MASKKKTSENVYVVNRKARHDFHISDKYVAGIVLAGAEVKAVRAGKMSLADCYAKFDRNGELWLINAHIGRYQSGKQADLDPARRRKLLLNKAELTRLLGQTKTKGVTLVPLKVFNSNNRVKVELGLAKGKKQYDKKEDKNG